MKTTPNVSITEMKVGNIVFTVHSEYSETATETIKQKIKRMISNNISEIDCHKVGLDDQRKLQ
jgi:hypothetical protein